EAVGGYRRDVLVRSLRSPTGGNRQGELSTVRNGKRMMVTAFVIAGLAAGFGWAQLVSTPAHAAAPPPAQVKVVDAPDPNQPKGYEPADITVKVGQAVNWQNTGNEGHTVTADDNSFDSGMKQHG